MAQPSPFQFAMVEQKKPRWSSFAASFAVQAVGIAVLVQFGVIQPRQIATAVKHYNVIELTADTPTAHPQPPQQILKKAPLPRPDLDHVFEERAKVTAPTAHVPPAPVFETRVPAMQEKLPVVQAPRVPQVGQFASAARATVAVAKPEPSVQTGAFSSGSSAAPTLQNVKARDVQTGGFGDPNGVRGVGDGKGKLVAAAVGSFELPGGAGNGNGTGGAKGAKGTIASAGFGNGVATSNPGRLNGGTVARGAIAQGGFGDARPALEQPRLMRASLPVTSATTTPVEILSKPQPVYTDEARALKLEGEVVLEVLFSASGEARVSRVVRGLGHGLDESARRAAERIRFKPAKREGQPVDSAAVIHVVFQLAY